MKFDWNTWSTLARENPEEFERRRREEIEAVIAAASPEHQQRLRGLQFRIDVERQRSSSPMGACVRINRMMWESFAQLRTSLQDLQGELTERRQAAPPAAARLQAPVPAQVLPFKPAR